MDAILPGLWGRRGMMFYFRALYIVGSLILLSGCTTMGSHILKNPDVYLPEPELLSLDPVQLGMENKTYCPSLSSTCVEYLYAVPYHPQEFSKDANVFYNLHATGNGVENTVSYRASTINFNRIKGTAVLVHGFGGSKEAMLATAIYFRAIGMHVIALDLFGHGQSTKDFVFGTKEHEQYAQLIAAANAQMKLPGPIIVVGHSMGALPAANLFMTSNEIDGAILLAPMMQFDLAAKHYLAYKNQTLNHLFSDHLDDIVSSAFTDNHISVQETNIPDRIENAQKPILIINSDVDSISPGSYFSHLANAHIQTEIWQGRSHPSLISFDQADVALIEDWITDRFGSDR